MSIFRRIKQAKVAGRCARAKKEKSCTTAIRGYVKAQHAYPPKGGRGKKRSTRRRSKSKTYSFNEPAVPVTSGYEITAYQ